MGRVAWRPFVSAPYKCFHFYFINKEWNFSFFCPRNERILSSCFGIFKRDQFWYLCIITSQTINSRIFKNMVPVFWYKNLLALFLLEYVSYYRINNLWDKMFKWSPNYKVISNIANDEITLLITSICVNCILETRVQGPCDQMYYFN